MRLYDLLDVINSWDLVTIRMAYEREPLVEEEACVRALRTLTRYHDCIVQEVFTYPYHNVTSVITIIITEED